MRVTKQQNYDLNLPSITDLLKSDKTIALEAIVMRERRLGHVVGFSHRGIDLETLSGVGLLHDQFNLSGAQNGLDRPV